MSVRKFSTASIKSGVKSSKFWDQVTTLNDYVLIESQEIGSGGASDITFSSISGSYKHLELRYVAKTTTVTNDNGVSWSLRPNNNTTTADYIHAGTYGQRNGADDNQALATPGTAGLLPWWNINTSKSGLDSHVGSGNVFIFDYANTSKHKTMIMQGGFHYTDDAQMSNQILIWESNDAITSLKLVPNAGSWEQYTKFSLYGVK